jgi:hypothetical protein
LPKVKNDLVAALAAKALRVARKALDSKPMPADEAAIARAVLAQIPRADIVEFKREIQGWLDAQDLKGDAGRDPTEAEIAAAVLAYVSELDLKGGDGQDATPEQVSAAVDVLLPPMLSTMLAAMADDLKGQPGEDADPVTDDQIADAVAAYIEPLDLKGPKGDSPDTEELEALISKQVAGIKMPVPKDGKTPTKAEISAIVDDVMKGITLPVAKDGVTPSKKDVLNVVVEVVSKMDLVGPRGVGIEKITQPRKTIMRLLMTDGTEYDIELPKPLVTNQMSGGGGGLSEAKVRELINAMNPLAGYHSSDEDPANDIRYYGYVKANSVDWYIARVDSTADPITTRYTVDSTDYATAWANYATLTYSNLQDIVIK